MSCFKEQGLDREIVGGILATILLTRGIIFVMSSISIFAASDNGSNKKAGFPTHIILIEEFAGNNDSNILCG